MKREQRRLIKLITSWLLTNGVKNFLIDDDLTISVFGDVDLSRREMDEIPSYINFKTVKGSFDCSENSLTSLRGCPSVVASNFYCFHNQLTSLLHAPREVGGKFFCHGNKRSFSREEVSDVCDVNVIMC